MDSFDQETLKPLLNSRATPCISLYIPMQHAGADNYQNLVRTKVLLRTTEQKLKIRQIDEAAIRTLLKPAEALVKQAEFWEHPGHGLALFRAPDYFAVYRLPRTFVSSVSIGSRFTIRPLLPLLEGHGRFFILALSHNHVRLLRATRDTVEEVTWSEAPKSLAESLRFDDPERQIHSHSGGPGKNAIFHGKAEDDSSDKEHIRQFFHQLDRSLPDEVRREGCPLVLAAVSYLFPLYGQQNTYAGLMPGGVPGNPDHLSANELHQHAWERVAPVFQQHRNQAIARFAELIGTGYASADLVEVLIGAWSGRVETLFVAEEPDLWGIFYPETGGIQRDGTAEKTEEEDLLNVAVDQTLRHGGMTYALPLEQMPRHALLAAIFRG